jgi:oxygen-independent coproporphyrinogen-3 oxidase
MIQGQQLIKEFNRPVPRYTSYPTAVKFHDGFGEADYRRRLAAGAASDAPIALYAHFPFCNKRCSYCGCHAIATPHQEPGDRYLGYLRREIELLPEDFRQARPVSRIHWGGGTPTFHSAEQLASIIEALRDGFRILPDASWSVEIDPRFAKDDQLATLRRGGFRRVSLGVQDFDLAVQAAIGRHQSHEQTRHVFEACRRLGFGSINIDLVYGLPLQTPVRFRRTLRAVERMRPDRIAIYGYGHLPARNPHQRKILGSWLPDARERFDLAQLAREVLTGAGYEPVGLDHYALPGDPLLVAAQSGRLRRDFMGYTTRSGTELIGLGASAIGEIGDAYVQNAAKLSDYYRAIDAGRLPVVRGYAMTADDRIRRHVIRTLMCDFRLPLADFESKHGVRFERYFAPEIERLTGPGGWIEAGVAELDDEALALTPEGRILVRNVCAEFDTDLGPSAARPPTQHATAV